MTVNREHEQNRKHGLNETENYNSKYMLVYDKDIIYLILKSKCATQIF